MKAITSRYKLVYTPPLVGFEHADMPTARKTTRSMQIYYAEMLQRSGIDFLSNQVGLSTAHVQSYEI